MPEPADKPGNLPILPFAGGAVAFLAVMFFLVRALFSAGQNPTPPPQGPATRIVALSPAVASIIRDPFGDGARSGASLLAGRHGFDAWSDARLPVCGDQNGIDYETLLRVSPTHVYLDSLDIPARLAELAKERNWTIRTHRLLTLDQIAEVADALFDEHLATNESRRQPGLSPGARLDAVITRRDDGFSSLGKVLLLVSPTGALGPGSFHQQILERLGGVPAITEGKPYITLDAEDVLRLRPDAIVLFIPRSGGAESRSGSLTKVRRDELLGVLANLDLPAIAHSRVALIDDPECLLPSMAVVRVAEDLATVLGSWRGPVKDSEPESSKDAGPGSK